MTLAQHSETQSWAVNVERNGESVVTIASNCLAGRDLSPEDKRVIRIAAEHLFAFLGARADTGARQTSGAEQQISMLREENAELRTLASIGTWHNDCRPNRQMAAREIQKSQAVNDKLADAISELNEKLRVAEAERDDAQKAAAQWRDQLAARIAARDL